MLLERLVGGWQLIEILGETVSGETFYPMGEKVAGQLVYTPEGHVNVNITGSDRSRGDSTTPWLALDDAVSADMARTYMAYAGTYSVDEDAAIVTHNLTLGLDPAMLEVPQVRHVSFTDEGHLILSAAVDERPDAPTAHLEWRRG
jgi:hypothetical protein